MDKLFEFLQGFSVQTILSMAAMLWYFTHDIKKDVSDIKTEMKYLDKDLRHMNTRTSRMEGTIYNKKEIRDLEDENH